MDTPVQPHVRHLQRCPNPLWQVIGWELRRLAVTWWGWLALVVATMVMMIPLATSLRESSPPAGLWEAAAPYTPSLYIFLATAAIQDFLGLVSLLISVALTAQDVQRRAHELLMVTRLPNWAYIWGRWLVGVVMCIGFNLIVLIGLVVADQWVAPAISATTPRLGLPFVLGWVMLAPLAIIFYSAVGFALGTLFPHQTNLLRLVAVAAWATSLYVMYAKVDAAYQMWLPGRTKLIMQTLASLPLFEGVSEQEAVQLLVREAEALARTLLLSQLIYIGAGLLLVALLARWFRRFRNYTV